MIWVRLFDHVRSGALFLALPGCACCDLLSWQQCTMSKLPSGVATVSSSDLQTWDAQNLVESPSRSWFGTSFLYLGSPKRMELQWFAELDPTHPEPLMSHPDSLKMWHCLWGSERHWLPGGQRRPSRLRWKVSLFLRESFLEDKLHHVVV
jgi:hypothetical protein